MGWTSCKHRQQLCVVRVRLRLINMGEHRVIKKVFNEQYAAAINQTNGDILCFKY